MAQIEYFVDGVDDLADGDKDKYLRNVDPETKQEIDGYHLDLNFNREGWAVEDVKDLKSALQKERTAAKTAKTELGKYEGLDVEVARKAIERQQEFDKKDWTKDEKVLAQLAEKEELLKNKYEGTLNTLTTENATLTKDLHEHLVDVQAISAINEKKGSVKLLLPHVRQFARVEKDSETGKRIAHIVEADGKTMRITMKTGSTDPMGFAEFVEQMSKMDEFMPAFEGTGQSGSGASASDRAGSSRSGVHRISYIDAQDTLKYRAAKAAAEAAKATLEVEPQPLQPGSPVIS